MKAIYDTKEARKLAKAAIAQSVRELNDTPRQFLDTSNPNHPNYDLHIFGYHQDEFLKKQNKTLDTPS